MKKLTDMKLSAKKGKLATTPEVATSSPPYPWGLRINLENEALKKLDMTVKDFGIGTRMLMQCQVEVVSVSEFEELKGRKDRSIGLQIIKMAL